MSETEFSQSDLEVVLDGGDPKERDVVVVDEVPSVESEKTPSIESTNQLFADFNQALATFTNTNPDVSQRVIMMTILHSMLSFPYSWMKQIGNEDKFVEAITSEAMVYGYLSMKKDYAELKSVMAEGVVPQEKHLNLTIVDISEYQKEPIIETEKPEKKWVCYLEYLKGSLTNDDYLDFLEAMVSPRIYEQSDDVIKILVEGYETYDEILWLAPESSLPLAEEEEKTYVIKRKQWWKKYAKNKR